MSAPRLPRRPPGVRPLFVRGRYADPLTVRTMAYLYGSGGIFAAVGTAIEPHLRSHEALTLYAISALSLAASGGLLALRNRMPTWALPASVAAGTVMISFGSASVPELFSEVVYYMELAAFSAFFLTRPQIVAQILLIGAGLAVGLAATHHLSEDLGQYVTIMGGIATGAVVVGVTRRRIEGLLDQLHRAAVTDPLTGLANRRAFVRALELEVRRADRHERPLALIYGDLDKFKQVNDRLGHRAGDETLERVAGVLRREARGSDLIARIGGEEFVIVAEADTDAAIEIAERIRLAVAAEFEDDPVALTISFGVATHDVGCETADAIIAAADSALYAAKQKGRNRTEASGAAAGNPA